MILVPNAALGWNGMQVGWNGMQHVSLVLIATSLVMVTTAGSSYTNPVQNGLLKAATCQ